jgi:hypothetical protein
MQAVKERWCEGTLEFIWGEGGSLTILKASRGEDERGGGGWVKQGGGEGRGRRMGEGGGGTGGRGRGRDGREREGDSLFPVGSKLANLLVVAPQPVHTGLDQDEPELGIAVLPVI